MPRVTGTTEKIVTDPNTGQPVREIRYEYDDDDRKPKKKPKACQACGGPYPACRDGCAIFWDDP